MLRVTISALIRRQSQQVKMFVLAKYIPFLATGSTVAVQEEDRGLWMHGTIVGQGTDDHTRAEA